MQTSVIITFDLEGIHSFPEARELFPDVGFLADSHRHMFSFRLAKKVNHDDRDVEFIRWKRHVISHLRYKYEPARFDSSGTLNFGRMSCEEIAKELLLEHDCIWVEVGEDRENWARVEI